MIPTIPESSEIPGLFCHRLTAPPRTSKRTASPAGAVAQNFKQDLLDNYPPRGKVTASLAILHSTLHPSLHNTAWLSLAIPVLAPGKEDPTERYLLFDSGCLFCTSLAHKVEEAADGQLTARGLGDPDARSILDDVKPG